MTTSKNIYSQNKPTGSHVCVDYPAGAYGDLLRCFISQHEGFETIKYVNSGSGGLVTAVTPQPNTKVSFNNVKNLEDYNSAFNYEHPNANEYRQCYKIKSHLPQNKHGHTTVNVTWLEHHNWDYSEYEILRQTNHKIVFVVLSPFSKYKDLYLSRHITWNAALNVKLELSKEGTVKKHKVELFNTDIEAIKQAEHHYKTWKKNYLTYEYPKHELNHEIEINNLLDKDDETYYNLIKFLNVKPLENWKDCLQGFIDTVFSDCSYLNR